MCQCRELHCRRWPIALFCSQAAVFVPFPPVQHAAHQNGFCLSTAVIIKHPLLIVFLIMPLARLLILVYVYTTLVYLNEIVIQLRASCLLQWN
jgi:hypothetical protein